ncbi:MAG: insulinase family protein [Archangiaceae bacterium]|nr:insulinase family protein [Archangiaceae bacterium]
MLTLLSLSLLAAPPTLQIPFERYHLSNGLTVILYPDRRLPTVAVELWYRVGSKEEPKGRTGFAHLFEHLMFMGTANVPNGKFDAIMEAEGGSNNATTDLDRTNYFESGPSQLLETFLWLEADRLASLPDAMTRAKVDLQREVVKNERRQSIENRPYGKLELIIPDKMYPPGHPYHHPVIGSHADLTAASVDDVKRFFATWYVPSNASLVIAGDFEPKAARALVEKYFGWMTRAPRPQAVWAAPLPPLAKNLEVTETDRVELPQVTLVWRSARAYAPLDAECELLATVLGEGKSSRLYRALVLESQLASDVSVEQQGETLDGTLQITATAQPGHTGPELVAAIDAELKALTTDRPITAAETERARTALQTHLLKALQSSLRVADLLSEMEARFGDPGQLERSGLARFDALDPSDLQEAVRSVLQQPRLTVTLNPEPKKTKEPARGR